MDNYKYIDELIKTNLTDSKAKVNISWKSIQDKINQINMKPTSFVKAFFSSVLTKVILFIFFISTIIFLASNFFKSNQENTNYLIPKNIEFNFSQTRQVIHTEQVQLNLNNSQTPKILPDKNIIEPVKQTTIININKTETDTIRIK